VSFGAEAVDVVIAGATIAAVVVALGTSVWAAKAQRRALQVDGRRAAALEIAGWVQAAESGVLAWHDSDNWIVPEGIEYGPETGIEPGGVVPPSQGRMGPSLEASIERFDAVRGQARLAFGPRHEVTWRVKEFIDATQHVADRGVIYAEGETAPPRDYVDKTFLPLAHDLFEALGEAVELRDEDERVPRSGVKATDHRR
jgi:hypothetical protein